MPYPSQPRLTHAVLLLVLCLPVLPCAAQAGRVLFTSGPVLVVAAEQPAHTPARGEALTEGQLLRTGAGGNLQVRLDDGSLLGLLPETDLRLNEVRHSEPFAQHQHVLSLYRGRLRIAPGTARPPKGSRIIVNTPLASLEAIGQEFSLELGEELRVSVPSGRVMLRNDAGSLLLRARDRALVRGRKEAPLRLPGLDAPAN